MAGSGSLLLDRGSLLTPGESTDLGDLDLREDDIPGDLDDEATLSSDCEGSDSGPGSSKDSGTSNDNLTEGELGVDEIITAFSSTACFLKSFIRVVHLDNSLTSSACFTRNLCRHSDNSGEMSAHKGTRAEATAASKIP